MVLQTTQIMLMWLEKNEEATKNNESKRENKKIGENLHRSLKFQPSSE